MGLHLPKGEVSVGPSQALAQRLTPLFVAFWAA